MKDVPAGCIFAAVLLLSVFDKQLEAAFPAVAFLFSPVTYVVLAGAAGLLISLARKGGRGK